MYHPTLNQTLRCAGLLLPMVLLAACGGHKKVAKAETPAETPVVEVKTPELDGRGSYRFLMSNGDKKMTADEFDAWMKANGIRVAKGNGQDAAAKPVVVASKEEPKGKKKRSDAWRCRPWPARPQATAGADRGRQPSSPVGADLGRHALTRGQGLSAGKGSDPGMISPDHAQFDTNAGERIDRAIQVLAAVRGADLGPDAAWPWAPPGRRNRSRRCLLPAGARRISAPTVRHTALPG